MRSKRHNIFDIVVIAVSCPIATGILLNTSATANVNIDIKHVQQNVFYLLINFIYNCL